MNTNRVPGELVMRYRRATGLPVMAAKRKLEECDPNDWLALIAASENTDTPDGMARDPLEDDETVGLLIRDVLDAVTERVIREHDEHIAKMRQTSPDLADFLSNRRGICHLIWNETQKALREEHGIEWRTPRELNPQTIFD